MAESSERYKVPVGFRALLEALSREVLRVQPDDIYAFSGLFFENLLSYRADNPGMDVLNNSDVYQQLKKNLLNQWNDRKSLIERSKSSLDEAAIKIQAAFRGHNVRIHPERFGMATGETITKSRSHEFLDFSDKNKNTKRHSLGSLVSTEDRAATKIQSEIRGFLTRRWILMKKDDDAATKIQANVRGYLARKHLNDHGNTVSEPECSEQNPEFEKYEEKIE